MAKQLRKLDWERGIEGTTVVEPTYPILVNGVSKEDINFERDKPEEINAKVEQSNPETITVLQVTSLWKRSKNPGVPTHSIVVYANEPKEAIECIL